jgi:hypothetical protein
VLLQAHAKEDTVIFTELDKYQRAGDKSAVPSCLHLRYYTDLAQAKGIVLVRGEVDLTRFTTTGTVDFITQLGPLVPRLALHVMVTRCVACCVVCQNRSANPGESTPSLLPCRRQVRCC